jgi:hypothetical protein
LNFLIKEIRENDMSLEPVPDGSVSPIGQPVLSKFTDYVLAAEAYLQKDPSKFDVRVRLRMIPDENGNRAIVLSNYYETAYNEELHNVCKDASGKFVVDDDNPACPDLHEEYWRVGDVKTPYLANVNNGSWMGQFWDFSRLTTVETVEVEQFVFVEMSKDDGWFQIWRGADVNPGKISVF